jgi:tetratricopeptide (TPR) repeat protein
MRTFSKKYILVFILTIFTSLGIVFSIWIINYRNSISVKNNSNASTSWTATDRLINSLRQQIRQNPNDSFTHSKLGHAYLQKARETGDSKYYDRAEKVFSDALDIDSQNFEAMNGIGMVHLSRHQFLKALEWAERSLKINPFKSFTYGIMVDAYIELGQYKKAIESAQKMINLRPDISSYSRVSYIRELMGDVDGAISSMESAIKSGAPNTEATNWCRVYLGHLYFNKGDIKNAELKYNEVLFYIPEYGHALAGLAKIRSVEKKFNEAILLYKHAIETMPIPEYVIELAKVYQSAKMKKEAEAQYQEALSILEFERKSGVDNEEEIALLLADWNRNLDKAVELAKNAHSRKQTIKTADILSWALYKSGDYQEALKYNKEALRFGTKYAHFFYHAGIINYKLGNLQEAKEYLEKAFVINPFFAILNDEDDDLAIATLGITKNFH